MDNNIIEEVDVIADQVICSKSFKECQDKDNDSNCIHPDRKGIVCRCWYILECPKGEDRN